MTFFIDVMKCRVAIEECQEHDGPALLSPSGAVILETLMVAQEVLGLLEELDSAASDVLVTWLREAADVQGLLRSLHTDVRKITEEVSSEQNRRLLQHLEGLQADADGKPGGSSWKADLPSNAAFPDTAQMSKALIKGAFAASLSSRFKALRQELWSSV